MTVRLPLFPLASVLFPGLVLPLAVFEARYRRLVADLAALPEEEPRRFGVVAIKDGFEVASARPGTGLDASRVLGGEPETPAGELGPRGQEEGLTEESGADATAGLGPDPAKALYQVGCMAEIATMRLVEEGRYELITSGTTRFRLRSIETTGPYLIGEMEPLPERRGEGAGALAAGVSRAFTQYQKRLAGTRERTLVASQDLPDDPTVLSYLVAAATTVETSAKQRLLEARSTADRLTDELALLRHEAAIIGRLPSLPAVELTRKVPSSN